MQRLLNQLRQDGYLASADYHAELPSTNTTATAWLHDKTSRRDAIASQTPRLVITDRQTAGRGRLGRTWTAQTDGIAMSLIVAGCHEFLSLAVGVAIAETIEYVAGPLACGLKWPNDVWVSQRKAAGTLIERVEVKSNESERLTVFAVIGIGINVGSSPSIENERTTSIAESAGRPVRREDVLSELIPALLERIRDCDSDRDGLIDAFSKRCVLTGTEVSCQIAGEQVQGRCDGIDAGGGLRIETPGGVRLCRSGEVQRVRPV